MSGIKVIPGLLIALISALVLTPSPATGSTSTPSGPGFQGAKAQWVGDVVVVGQADQNIPLELAVMDLRQGESSDTGDRSAFVAAINSIRNFENIPITGVTANESAQLNADIASVDQFFGLTSNPWHGGCLSRGKNATAAAKAWDSEPTGTASGVRVAPLRTAVAHLRLGHSVDPDATTCYPAAIDDLVSLESASRGEISKSSRLTPLSASAGALPPGVLVVEGLYGDEIGYLNGLFGLTGSSEWGKPVLEAKHDPAAR